MPVFSVSRQGAAASGAGDKLSLRRCLRAGALALAVLLAPGAGQAQELLSGGDAAVTLFSGLERGADGSPRPDPDGAAVRLIGLGGMQGAPDGALREAPRLLVSRTAGEIGQVFGVAFDSRSPANIYLAASSGFGLYRTANGDWAEGMWGPDGGPGTIWKLNAARGYRAEKFAEIGYLDEPNAAAGLGDLAYDPWHEQLFVSDLESGLIHRLDMRDGELLESFDHGADGRALFFDALTGEDATREPVLHDPTGAPRFDDCAVEFEGVEDEMPFDSAAECWNFADFQRRVWGLGVHRDGEDGEVRLYYAIWGGASLGSADWAAEAEDAATSIWSVALTEGGWFDATDVRREIILPAIAGADDDSGEKPPVTGIAFTENGAMILAERPAPAPYFEDAAHTQLLDPDNARVLRLARNGDDVWEIDGRYAVGYPIRAEAPEIRANAGGGVALPVGGQGLIWMTVTQLCSEDAPCPDAQSGEPTLSDRVAGIQAVPEADIVALDDPDEGVESLERAYLFSVRGAGRVPGDIGAIALHPGDAPPVRIVDRPARPEPEPDPDEEDEARDEPVDEPDEIEPETVSTDLGVEKSALETCEPGEDCRFELTLTNLGDEVFDEPILITDTLGTAGTDFVAASPPGEWMCHAANAHIFCRSDGLDLAPGESASLELTVRLAGNHRSPRLENCGAITWLGRGGRDRIRAVQAELNRRGFEAGPVDGAMGPRTADGISAAEDALDLPDSGEITGGLIEALFGAGSYLAGDASPDNDRACASATVDVPAPPPAEVRQPSPRFETPRPHDRIISRFHQRRASAQHNPATSAPTPVHQRHFSEFHMQYRSSQHDGVRSEFVAGHDRVMSRFHQRFDSRVHDIETSGPHRFHSIRDSALDEMHDGVTSRAPRAHEGWTSRWR